MARMGRGMVQTRFWCKHGFGASVGGRDHFEDRGVRLTHDIKMDLYEVRLGKDWIKVAQERKIDCRL
jgi:hypothetical protein